MSITEEFELKVNGIYSLLQSDGTGNDCFSEDRVRWLNEAKTTLLMKYPETDFRVRYIDILLVHHKEDRYTIQDQEQLRYIFHAECYPEDPHSILLDDLRERMDNKGKLHKISDFGDEP